jgi:O-antigen/teichoic acid export membrane protein
VKDIFILNNTQPPKIDLSKKIISKKIFLTIGVNTFGRITNFLITLILARIFAPEIIGMLGFANAVAGIVFLMSKFGLENYILREVPQNPGSAVRLYHHTLTLNIFSIFTASIVFIIIAVLLVEPSIELKILIIIFISAILGVISELSIAYYKAFFQIILEAYLRLTHRLSMLFIVLPLIYFTEDIDIYLLSIFFLALVISISSILILRFKLDFNFVFVSLKESFGVVKKSYKFALLSVAAFALVQLDIIIIKTILGNESAGYYKIASVFYFPFTIIPGSMMGVILPLLSKYKDEPDKFESIQNKVYRLLTLLSVIIVYSVSIFASPFIEHFFLGKYNSSIPVLMILIWALVPYYLDMISGYVLIADGYEKEPLKINSIAILVSLISNIVLIHAFGITGAAISVIIVISSKWILSLIRLKHYKKLYKKNLNIFLFLLFSLINFLVYQELNVSVIPRHVILIVTFAIIVKTSGLLEKGDIQEIKTLFVKQS